MRKLLTRWTNVFFSVSLFSAFTVASFDVAFAAPNDSCVTPFTQNGEDCEVTFRFSDSTRLVKIPQGLGPMQIELFGAAGGAGGLDCGVGCTSALSSQVGRLVLGFSDLSGKTVEVYPGESGGNGGSGVRAGGSGPGGRSSFGRDFDGGQGGKTGPIGTSGGGGGGGAATLLVLDGQRYIAAGGGGGGGSANSRNGSTFGNTQQNYSQSSRGGDGLDGTGSLALYQDGGGGGGGGAGVLGGLGGAQYRAPSGEQEAAGYGGSAGTNTPLGGQVLKSQYEDARGGGTVTLRYKAKLNASALNLLTKAKSNSTVLNYQVILQNDRSFTDKDVIIQGTAAEQTDYAIKIGPKKIIDGMYSYTFSLAQTEKNPIMGTVEVQIFGANAPTAFIDQFAPNVFINLQGDTQKTSSHIYEVTFDKAPLPMSQSSFIPAKGSAKGCKISDVSGEGKYYKVSLTGCSDGTYGIVLLAGAAKDESGNYNQEPISSELTDQFSPTTSAKVIEGTIPKEFKEVKVKSILAEVSSDVADALAAKGVYAPMPEAPQLQVITDLTQINSESPFKVSNSQQLEAGSSFNFGAQVSPDIAENFDAVAFMETDTLWQFLGRASFENNIVKSQPLGMATPGLYKVRLLLIPKDVQLGSMSLKTGHGKSLSPKAAISDSATLVSDQLIELTLDVIPGPDGAPTTVGDGKTVDNTPTSETPLGTLAIGQPIANSAIGATGDDNAPSIPFNPLGSPEAVKAVAKTTVTAVAVVSTVAAAASAAAGAAASSTSSAASRTVGSGSSTSGASTSSTASNQDTNSADGSIDNIDAQVEAFTSHHIGIGDNFPIFRSKILTFLDKFTHNLTVKMARFSPVISKIINDGAYLRAVMGSFWLLFPIIAVVLAQLALSQPTMELSPPVWQLFIAIAVLGLFDAFSGLLASLIFVIGMTAIHGISSVSDVRLLLGILVLGFGPALISIAFRSIRRHFETSFNYFWERVVDIAVLTFFTGWTASTMVATLPALAGKTLQAANHVQDFGIFLAVAIAVRIVLEEIAARAFPARLDTINPTEVPETSLVQKVLSTALRLATFIFVTAAFMGNTWQVWVGSLIFILPNIFSWFEDKLPKTPVIWRIIPQGVPGLAFGLLVASFSSMALSNWIGHWQEYPQYSFMLLPIPMFLVGLIALFGKEEEERMVKRHSYRWLYRVGGIVVLLATIKLAGVI